MGVRRGRHGYGDLRLANHVQPPHVGRMARDGRVMFGQIVDEQRDAGIMRGDDRGQRFALRPVIPLDREVEAKRRQLLDTEPCSHFIHSMRVQKHTTGAFMLRV